MLAEEQLGTIEKWLNDHLKNFECPICHTHKYMLNGMGFVATPIIKGNVIETTGQSMPSIQIVCSHCAFIMNFSIQPMGLL